MLLLASLIESVIEDVVANKITEVIPTSPKKRKKNKTPFHIAASSIPENTRIAVEHIEDTALIIIPKIDEVESVNIRFKPTEGKSSEKISMIQIS